MYFSYHDVEGKKGNFHFYYLTIKPFGSVSTKKYRSEARGRIYWDEESDVEVTDIELSFDRGEFIDEDGNVVMFSEDLTDFYKECVEYFKELYLDELNMELEENYDYSGSSSQPEPWEDREKGIY